MSLALSAESGRCPIQKVVDQAKTVFHTESDLPSSGSPFLNIARISLSVPVDHDNNMRVRIFILAILLTNDGDGWSHLMFGRFVWFVPPFSPEPTTFQQNVISFKIPG